MNRSWWGARSPAGCATLGDGRWFNIALMALVALVACAGCGTSVAPAVESAVAPPGRSAPPMAPMALPPIDPAPMPEAIAPTLPLLEAPAGSLDAWFAGLGAAQRGEQGRAGRVAVAIFGDSHTAGDRMTARLRQVLTARFGDAGRGLVAMGKPPIRHYYLTEVRYGSLGKWSAAIGGSRDHQEPFGLAGLRVSTQDRRASSWVESCIECGNGGRVGRFELLYWKTPGGAKLRYRVDHDPWHTLSTALAAPGVAHAARAVIEVADGPHRLTVAPASSGSLALFGVALERTGPGVVIDGLGVVGRTLSQLASWQWTVIGAQLAERDPRLVVLQYGSNEAEQADLDLALLARRYDQVIARVRAAVPQSSILLLGPPDMAVRQAGKACDDPHRQPASIPALDGEILLPIDPQCQWLTPARLFEIIAVQREAALRNGVAFFDSLAALGGAGQMVNMVLADPPLAARDHVHFTALGYQRWADALLSELLHAFAAAESETGVAREPALAPIPDPSLAPES